MACVFGGPVHADWCEVAEMIGPNGETRTLPLTDGEVETLVLAGWTWSSDTDRRLDLAIARRTESLGLRVA